MCLYVLQIAQEPFLKGTLHLAGVLLGTQRKCSVDFGAIWTPIMFNIIKPLLWLGAAAKCILATQKKADLKKKSVSF